jgi:multidrug resistance efflux pump
MGGDVRINRTTGQVERFDAGAAERDQRQQDIAATQARLDAQNAAQSARQADQDRRQAALDEADAGRNRARMNWQRGRVSLLGGSEVGNPKLGG